MLVRILRSLPALLAGLLNVGTLAAQEHRAFAATPPVDAHAPEAPSGVIAASAVPAHATMVTLPPELQSDRPCGRSTVIFSNAQADEGTTSGSPLRRLLDPQTFALLCAFAAAGVAVFTFTRERRLKAADYVLRLEEEYGKHIDTLIALECPHDYRERFESAISKAIRDEPESYSSRESWAILKLENALRHFLTAFYLRRLRVDAGILNASYQYYVLTLFDSPERPDLRTYIDRFWPPLALWSRLVRARWYLRWYLLAEYRVSRYLNRARATGPFPLPTHSRLLLGLRAFIVGSPIPPRSPR